MEKETFLDRLKQEHKELDDKVCKLLAFTQTEGFFDIGGANKLLLKEQLSVMTRYLDILSIRLALLKV